MKTTTTLAALLICVCAAASSFAQDHLPNALVRVQPTLIERPQVGPSLNGSAYLGLVIQHHNARGLYVESTMQGGPAASAGLERGDIIVGAEGYYVDTLKDLEDALRNSYGSIEITVKDINTGRWVNTTMRYTGGGGGQGGGGGGVIGNAVAFVPGLGVEVEMLNHGGYKITNIRHGSVAQKINLTVGDTILKVNNTKIENINHPEYTFARSFSMVYNDIETGHRYTLNRTVYGP